MPVTVQSVGNTKLNKTEKVLTSRNLCMHGHKNEHNIRDCDKRCLDKAQSAVSDKDALGWGGGLFQMSGWGGPL